MEDSTTAGVVGGAGTMMLPWKPDMDRLPTDTAVGYQMSSSSDMSEPVADLCISIQPTYRQNPSCNSGNILHSKIYLLNPEVSHA